MRSFTTLTAVAAPLLRDNIDTDAIIPSREIKAVSKVGLADGLFAGWRYTSGATRELDPDFVLNRAAYAHAKILLGGANFGCGSSREHAVWALAEYGIEAILAPSFAPIFFDNCVNNGLLAGRIPEPTLQVMAKALAAEPTVTIDLRECSVTGAAFGAVAFTIDRDARERLLGGLDAIDLTLRGIDVIRAFRTRDRQRRPWAYLEEGT